MKKKLCICIPTYNRQELVVETINSVLKQKDEGIDIHVFDNCSSDNTKEIIESEFGNAVYYHRNETNIGYVNNINKCLLLQRDYEWIGLLHSDDTYTPNTIKTFLGIIKNIPNSVGLVYSDFQKIVEKEQNNDAQEINYKGHLYKKGLEALKVAQGSIPATSSFIKSSAVEQVGLYSAEFPLSAEEEYSNRIAEFFDIYQSEYIFTNHRIHSGNYRTETWLSPDFKPTFERMRRLMGERMSKAAGYDVTKGVEMELGRLWFAISYRLAVEGHWRKAIHYNIDAWKYNKPQFRSFNKAVKSFLVFVPYVPFFIQKIVNK